MPYVITTKQPWSFGHHDRAYDSRRAVATLAQARQAVFTIAEDRLGIGRDIATQVEACHAVHETQPVSLPLPDGTVIEVAPVAWSRLEVGTGFGDCHGLNDAAVIDAYNAAQA